MVVDLAPVRDGDATAWLPRVADVEGKLVRALDALGPISDRDVVLLERPQLSFAAQVRAAGGRVAAAATSAPLQLPSVDGAADVVLALWSAFRGVDAAELAEADRVLRPGGRLLVVHDYGRDDVSRLRSADLPEYGTWSRRDGPFLQNGFKIRVVHCFWTFGSLEDAVECLAAYGAVGESLAHSLRRPRLSWNVAIYHRSRAQVAAEEPPRG